MAEAETHRPCHRCRTTDPEAFATPTGAYCDACWSWMTDHGRRFKEWIEEQTAPKARRWF
jgi:hypothetical protein